MFAPKGLTAGLLLAISLVIAAGQAHGARIGEKAALQVAMQQHIDRSLVDGAYLQLNEETGEVRSLYPLKAHPVILRMGDYFVLCSDFNDASGKSVNIDFYIARDVESYVVFHAAIDDRVMLQRLMDENKVERFD